MGIGNTTPAAALIAAGLGPARRRGDRSRHRHRRSGVGAQAVADRHRPAPRRRPDRTTRSTCLPRLGSADIAAGVGFLLGAARGGVPVLLDGVVSVAAALVADLISPGAVAWFAAGHRSTEPAQSLALDKLGLVPLLDLGMRLGEGSGAVAAVPLVRSASLLLARDGAAVRPGPVTASRRRGLIAPCKMTPTACGWPSAPSPRSRCPRRAGSPLARRGSR